MIRTFEQEMIQTFAQHSTVPVINGLTDQHHPCQVLADIFTFIEKNGSIRGATVAWIGDANNMCNSWIEAAETLDFQLHISSPPGYGRVWALKKKQNSGKKIFRAGKLTAR